jgi:hypothetical protein
MITIPLRKINIEDDGNHIVVTALLNNKPANLLIDTGASRTIFDSNRIHLFEDSEIKLHDRLSTGLGTNSMESKTITLGQLNIGDISIHNSEVILLDLEHVNVSYQKLNIDPIDGVIGGDMLERYKAVIDYNKMTITLQDTNA